LRLNQSFLGMNSYRFECKPFYQLSLDELYALMALRQEVFIVEQNCPYLDADGRDQMAWHLMVYAAEGEQLVACTRLLPPDSVYQGYQSIGRVVTSPLARGTGVGKVLMIESIRQCVALFGEGAIKIGAQSYLLAFYGGFGFESTGEEYMEDGIPHTKMVRRRMV
jgi:ElaA protein